MLQKLDECIQYMQQHVCHYPLHPISVHQLALIAQIPWCRVVSHALPTMSDTRNDCDQDVSRIIHQITWLWCLQTNLLQGNLNQAIKIPHHANDKLLIRPPINHSLWANRQHCYMSSFECCHLPWNRLVLSLANGVKVTKSKSICQGEKHVLKPTLMQVSSIVSRHFELLFPNKAKSSGSCDITQDSGSRTIQWRLAWICKFR